MQMLNALSYQDLMEQVACNACGRWKIDDNSNPAMAVGLRDVKRKVLYVQELPLAVHTAAKLASYYNSIPATHDNISKHHLAHTFCVADNDNGKASSSFTTSKCEFCNASFRGAKCKSRHENTSECQSHF